MPKGRRYWYIIFDSDTGKFWVNSRIDYYYSYDEARFCNGNYFHSEEEAESMACKLRAVFNGVEVIEQLNENDLLKARSDFDDLAKSLDEKGIGYKNIKEAKAAFLVGIQWRNSKIIK